MSFPSYAQPLGSVRVPVGWLLEHGSWAVRARVLADLGAGDAATAGAMAYAHAPALRLAVQQGRDGTWGARMLALPAPADRDFAGVGTIPAVRRLLEWGWEPAGPSFYAARKLLFRLLAEDEDPSSLYELRRETMDEFTIRRARAMVREGAAAALAHLGHEADPRLRGAAVRMLDRVATFLRSPTASDVLSAEGPLPAGAALPSAHFLVMLAHMPRFRMEHHEEMDRIYTLLAEPGRSGVVKQLVGGKSMDQPHLLRGDPIASRGDDAASLPTTLAWLEVLARLGFLQRNASWSAELDRLLVARDMAGIWRGRASKLGTPSEAWAWPTFPLSDPAEKDAWTADVTFRLALVARLAGRPLELE
jgi:hypothetical protein